MFPSAIDDVAFTNDAERRHVRKLMTGELSFPSHSKSGVLLYGSVGTGKTTLAHLLSVLLEHMHANETEKTSRNWCYEYRSTLTSITPHQAALPVATPASFTLINCGNTHSNGSSSIVRQIENISRNSLRHFCFASHFNHFLLDELDCWSKPAQANLKGLMTDSPSWNIFYVTTNKQHAIDTGIISRCITIEMNGDSSDHYLRALRQHHPRLKPYSDEQLTAIIDASEKDWRKLDDAISRLPS